MLYLVEPIKKGLIILTNCKGYLFKTVRVETDDGVNFCDYADGDYPYLRT